MNKKTKIGGSWHTEIGYELGRRLLGGLKEEGNLTAKGTHQVTETFDVIIPKDYNRNKFINKFIVDFPCNGVEELIHFKKYIKEFDHPTDNLAPGRSYKVKIIRVNGMTKFPDRIKIIKEEKENKERVMLVGMQGLILAYKQRLSNYIAVKNKLWLCLDKESSLWKDKSQKARTLSICRWVDNQAGSFIGHTRFSVGYFDDSLCRDIHLVCFYDSVKKR